MVCILQTNLELKGRAGNRKLNVGRKHQERDGRLEMTPSQRAILKFSPCSVAKDETAEHDCDILCARGNVRDKEDGPQYVHYKGAITTARIVSFFTLPELQ